MTDGGVVFRSMMNLKVASNGGWSWYVSGCCEDLIDVAQDDLTGRCRKCGQEVGRVERVDGQRASEGE